MFAPPKTDAMSAPAFNFGASVSSAGGGDAKSIANPWGAVNSSSAFTLGGLASTNATTPTPSFSFGGATGASLAPAAAVVTTATPLNLSATSTSSTVLGGLAFGGTTFKPSIPKSTSAAETPTASGSLFNFASGAIPTTSASATATAASSLPSFSLNATSSPSTVASLKPSTSATTGFALTTTVSTPAISIAANASSTLPTTGNITFNQLDQDINKWTIDLEEQGKLFANQAKQLNAWDRMLVSNGEKVLALNSGIKRVKQQQQQLDQELDFVLAQEKELEDLIAPLEKELNEIPLADIDRLHTYQLAENMDTQLKQMSEDLKEIIEQLNESNKSQDSSNPITQIRKILNAHFDSLQWIDRQTSKITGHLDQISKMHDMRRKTHEHSLKKTYD